MWGPARLTVVWQIIRATLTNPISGWGTMRTLVFCSLLQIVLFLSCFCSFAEISETFRSGCHFVPKRNQLRKRDIFHSALPPSSSLLLEKYKPVEPKRALRILVTSGCFLSPVFQLLARRLLWEATTTFIERDHHHHKKWPILWNSLFSG